MNTFTQLLSNIDRLVKPTCLAVVLIITAMPVAVLGRDLTPARFEVEAGSHKYWVFEVPESARIFGQFNVEGSGGNEIRVFIMDESEFENYRNGKGFRPHYQTDRVSGGEINLRLYSGRYVIVFDNTFSHFSNKTITSKLQIEYE